MLYYQIQEIEHSQEIYFKNCNSNSSEKLAAS